MSKKITDEDIEQGVAKVERMNKMFDKAILPVLLIAALAVFLFGALPKLIRNMNSSDEQPQAVVDYTDELTMYEQRSKFMDEIDMNLDRLQSTGYEQQPEVQGTSSISKQYDENTVVAHFYNGASSYGKVIKSGMDTCKKLDMQINNSVYISVSVTLNDGTRISAKFDSSFAFDETLTDTDTAEKLSVLNYVTTEELKAMLTLYDTELSALIS